MLDKIVKIVEKQKHVSLGFAGCNNTEIHSFIAEITSKLSTLNLDVTLQTNIYEKELFNILQTTLKNENQVLILFLNPKMISCLHNMHYLTAFVDEDSNGVIYNPNIGEIKLNGTIILVGLDNNIYTTKNLKPVLYRIPFNYNNIQIN